MVGVADIGVQLGLFEPQETYGEAHSGAPTAPILVQSDEDFAGLLRELEAAGRIAFDTETTGIDMTRCELVGLSFCTCAGLGWYVPAGDTGRSLVPAARHAPMRRACATC